MKTEVPVPIVGAGSNSHAASSSNSTHSVGNNAMYIQGYEVYFPIGRKPFPAQVAVMSKVLQAAKEGKNALLESPTGTGKTLALLSSTLAYQQAVRRLVDKEAALTGLAAGDDIKGEPRSPMNAQVAMHRKKGLKMEVKSPQSPMEKLVAASSSSAVEKLEKVHKVPKVYYATRTHSQLKQVAEELQRCHPIYTQDVSMVVLGSRQHFCSNVVVRNLAERNQMSVDEICQDLLSKRKKGGNNEADEAYPQSLRNGCPFLNDKRIDQVVRDVPPIWDIEALDQVAKRHKGCGYLAMRFIAKDAQYILTPYNYLIHPSIRQAMGIDLKDAIVVFDEAHNIEDVAREAGSLDATLDQVVTCLGELQRLGNNLQHVPTKQLTTLILHVQHFIEDMLQGGSTNGGGGFMTAPTSSHVTPATSSKQSSGTGYKSNAGDDDLVWEGSEFVDILDSRYQINASSLAVYQEYFKQFLELQNDIEEKLAMMQQPGEGAVDPNEDEADYVEQDGPNFPDPDEDFVALENPAKLKKIKKKSAAISIGSLSLLRNLLSVLHYLLQEDQRFVDDFRIVLQQRDDNNDFYNSKGGSSKKKKSALDNISLHIWCLSAGVVFQDITSQARSVLLSSGTLSPLDSFAGELATSFPIRVEANHVINLAQQLLVGCVSTLQDHSLSSVYQAQQSDWYLDLLGQLLYLIMRQVPGGVLMFVPSYALLNRLMARWSQQRNGGDGGSNSEKKATKKRAFDKKAAVQMEVDESSLLGKIQQDLQAQVYFEPKESALMPGMLQDFYQRLDEANEQKTTHSHASMIAVCRGKVSEGINFSDHYARAVIIIGIPYPSVADKKIDLKKKYQDRKATSKSTAALFPEDNNVHAAGENLRHADGATWYKQQAFRAINQAIGRCIRHKTDYGAILLVDPRYCQGIHNPQTSIISQLSKWLRNEAKVYERLEDLLLPLKLFYQRLNPTLLVANTVPPTVSIDKDNIAEPTGMETDDTLPPSKKKQVDISISQCFRKMKATSTSAANNPFTSACDTSCLDEDNDGDQHEGEEEDGEPEISFYIDRGDDKPREEVLPVSPVAMSPVPAAATAACGTKGASQRLFQGAIDDIQDADLLDIDLNFPQQPQVVFDAVPRSILPVDKLFQLERIQVLRDLQHEVLVTDLPANLHHLQLAFQHGLQFNQYTQQYSVIRTGTLSASSIPVIQLSKVSVTLRQEGYKVVEQWEASDGVVYRYLLEEVDRSQQTWSVLAAAIVASSSQISCLQVLDQCYGQKSLLSRLHELVPSKPMPNTAGSSFRNPYATHQPASPFSTAMSNVYATTTSALFQPHPTTSSMAAPRTTTPSHASGPFSSQGNDNLADYYGNSYFNNCK